MSKATKEKKKQTVYSDDGISGRDLFLWSPGRISFTRTYSKCVGRRAKKRERENSISPRRLTTVLLRAR